MEQMGGNGERKVRGNRRPQIPTRGRHGETPRMKSLHHRTLIRVTYESSASAFRFSRKEGGHKKEKKIPSGAAGFGASGYDKTPMVLKGNAVKACM